MDRVHFRDQLIAAPLKHYIADDTDMPIGDFRDQLIAAPLKPSPPISARKAAKRFPRSIDRGPIEAPPALGPLCLGRIISAIN